MQEQAKESDTQSDKARPFLKFKLMLTRQEIFDAAQKDAHEFPALNSKDATHEVAFIRGATWANEQNAAEIAKLVQALREIDEQLGDKQTLALTRILKDIVTNALKKYEKT